jgi:trimethylamine--corrinoid protein Co-methyltransferase
MRPLETTRALLERSDKPFLGSVAGADGARDSIALAQLVHPELKNRPVMMGLININSPLRLDSRMAGALVEYVRAGQAVLLTPGILMGVTAPVTVAGAMVQALAELLACVTLVQVLRPGAPVMIGTGGFGSDLRTGGPGFGRPENALGTILGAQLARRVGAPFRCSGAVTGSRLPDCRSGYERMMTALSAWSGGAHLCLQGAGTLDSINSMSYSQFAIDVEVWGSIKRLAARPSVDREALAVELISSLPGDYLGSAHTLEHLRQEMYAPSLAPPASYDEWISGGAPSVVDMAAPRARELERRGTVSPLPREILKEMDDIINARRR